MSHRDKSPAAGAIPTKALPRLDGQGAFCRAIIRALADSYQLNDMESRLWARVIAHATRGVCWHRTIYSLAKDYRVQNPHESVVPIRELFTNGPQGLSLSETGWKWLYLIQKSNPS